MKNDIRNVQPIVTIRCTAYNQKKYICKTIDSLLNQKTDYPYEILIHDDASTDGTKEIIQEYAEKYPNKIVAIIEKENQYSQKNGAITKIMNQYTRGKYVAYCEGDDYWTDENKLQLQVDYLEGHPDCPMVVHNTKKIEEDGRDTGLNINWEKNETDYGPDEIIRASNCTLFHTSSRMIRKELVLNKPSVISIPSIGDYPMAIWTSLNGNIHYYPQIMSAYRINVPGSWSKTKTLKGDGTESFPQLAIKCLNKINEYTNYKYNDAFQYAIINYRYMLDPLWMRVLKSIYIRDYRKRLISGLKRKIKITYDKN